MLHALNEWVLLSLRILLSSSFAVQIEFLGLRELKSLINLYRSIVELKCVNSCWNSLKMRAFDRLQMSFHYSVQSGLWPACFEVIIKLYIEFMVCLAVYIRDYWCFKVVYWVYGMPCLVCSFLCYHMWYISMCMQ